MKGFRHGQPPGRHIDQRRHHRQQDLRQPQCHVIRHGAAAPQGQARYAVHRYQQQDRAQIQRVRAQGRRFPVPHPNHSFVPLPFIIAEKPLPRKRKG